MIYIFSSADPVVPTAGANTPRHAWRGRENVRGRPCSFLARLNQRNQNKHSASFPLQVSGGWPVRTLDLDLSCWRKRYSILFLGLLLLLSEMWRGRRAQQNLTTPWPVSSSERVDLTLLDCNAYICGVSIIIFACLENTISRHGIRTAGWLSMH
jgi:hypothetical protein